MLSSHNKDDLWYMYVCWRNGSSCDGLRTTLLTPHIIYKIAAHLLLLNFIPFLFYDTVWIIISAVCYVIIQRKIILAEKVTCNDLSHVDVSTDGGQHSTCNINRHCQAAAPRRPSESNYYGLELGDIVHNTHHILSCSYTYILTDGSK